MNALEIQTEICQRMQIWGPFPRMWQFLDVMENLIDQVAEKWSYTVQLGKSLNNFQAVSTSVHFSDVRKKTT